jgi:hypothetical protein
MSAKDKLILTKLFKLAEKQQMLLTKLAQLSEDKEDIEGNKKYLSKTWMTAAVNSGVPGMTPESIEYIPGGTSPDNSNIVISSTYIVTGVIPENARMLFKTNFEKQIAAQKPELDGRVGMIFKDPAPKTAGKKY